LLYGSDLKFNQPWKTELFSPFLKYRLPCYRYFGYKNWSRIWVNINNTITLGWSPFEIFLFSGLPECALVIRGNEYALSAAGGHDIAVLLLKILVETLGHPDSPLNVRE